MSDTSLGWIPVYVRIGDTESRIGQIGVSQNPAEIRENMAGLFEASASYLRSPSKEAEVSC